MFATFAALLFALTAVTALPERMEARASISPSSRQAQFVKFPYSTVYFIKGRNVGSGTIVIKTFHGASNFGATPNHYTTIFSQDQWQNGVFDIMSGDLFFVKLRNTVTDKVEVYWVDDGSNYQTISVQAQSAFSISDAENGTWDIKNGDLCFIKTKNTGSGQVEVHCAGRSSYSTVVSQATGLSQSEDGRGTFAMSGNELFFIKYRGTAGQKVEVHIFNPSNGWQYAQSFGTAFDIADADNGTWDIDGNLNLVFIKTRNVGSGMVEIHIATFASNYQEIFHYVTQLSPQEAADGVWQLP